MRNASKFVAALALVLGGITASAAEPPVSTAAARELIQKQIDLLNAGDIAGLKATFIESRRDAITAEVVANGKVQVAKMKVQELVDSTALEEAGKSVSIKMTNGRQLTTLHLTDGKWLVGTVWWK